MMDRTEPSLDVRDPATPTPPPRTEPSEKPADERLLEQILYELKRHRERPAADFSMARLMGGIVQVVVLAALFLAYLNRAEATLVPALLFSLVLQTMVVALVLMGRDR